MNSRGVSVCCIAPSTAVHGAPCKYYVQCNVFIRWKSRRGGGDRYGCRSGEIGILDINVAESTDHQRCDVCYCRAVSESLSVSSLLEGVVIVFEQSHLKYFDYNYTCTMLPFYRTY